MSGAEIAFWVLAGLILYTCLGYPLLLGALWLLRRRRRPAEMTDWPRLSVLIVAFNEAGQIERKIRNVLTNGYPEDRVEVVVCSDGSTDRTNEIVSGFGDPRVKLAATADNRGVNEAFANGASHATGELLLLSDTGSLFRPEAIRTAVSRFADPRAGCVAGRYEYTNPQGRAVASGNRSYWAIETIVRRMESDLGVGCVLVGAFEVIRRELYRPIRSDVSNDMIVPMDVRARGYRLVYEPRAVIQAPHRKTPTQEFGRRVRMVVRAWTSMPALLRLVPVWKTPLNWLVLWSHKYMRWLTGVFMLGLLAANAFLLGGVFYRVAMIVQGVFYGLAVLGGLLTALLPRVPKVLVPAYYFCLLQAAAVVGLAQALAGRRIRTWKPQP